MNSAQKAALKSCSPTLSEDLLSDGVIYITTLSRQGEFSSNHLDCVCHWLVRPDGAIVKAIVGADNRLIPLRAI